MRQFFIFKIKEEYAILTKQNPHHLYRTLEQIYYVDQQDLQLGVDLFERMIEKLNPRQIDIDLFKNYKDNYFYSKYRNIHQIYDVYRQERTKLIVNRTYLEMESSIPRPAFLKDLEKEKNLFFCDFENKDYFWLEKIAV
ncbi:MAG: sporulation inhibitor of replication protein SirA [Bacilli bacterium]|jgi:hypothetical protein|nr:sporulation inhibitor of replication protein SirA [Bacilli bacterium]